MASFRVSENVVYPHSDTFAVEQNRNTKYEYDSKHVGIEDNTE